MDKVNQIVHHRPKQDEEIMAEQDGPGVKKAHNYKWTTVENQFTRKKNRLFDDLPEAQPTRADVMPLFSSFNPKGVFKPPQSSKDLQISMNKGRDTVTSQS